MSEASLAIGPQPGTGANRDATRRPPPSWRSCAAASGCCSPLHTAPRAGRRPALLSSDSGPAANWCAQIGAPRGFLPRGLYDAHPCGLACRHWCACAGGHPTTLNCTSQSPQASVDQGRALRSDAASRSTYPACTGSAWPGSTSAQEGIHGNQLNAPSASLAQRGGGVHGR